MIYDKNKCICGECSRKLGESLEERKDRALKLKWYHVYICGICGIYFYISYSGVTRSKEFTYIDALVDSDISRQGKIKVFLN